MRKMMAIGILLGLMASTWFCSGCSGSQSEKPADPQLTELAGPYLGQEPPGTTPSPFAPQLFSQEVHCTPAFSPDGQEVYWALMINDRSRFKHSKLVGGFWTQPAVPSFAQHDDSPVFSPDGNRLYFLRRGSVKENIFFVERTAEGWSAPAILPGAINSLRQIHWQFSIADNGDLYFAGGEGPSDEKQDIYRAELVDGQYSVVTKLEGTVNSDLLEHSPYIARDGSYLLFSRANGELSDVDLYVSFRQEDGSWGQAIRFRDPINAGGYDHCPRVSVDGKYLFFVSTRRGRSEPYWVDAGVIEELRPR